MKRLLGLALISQLLCTACSRHTDLIAAVPSPDGAIIAASNADTGEFPFEAQYNQVRLYPRGGRLRQGEVILSYGEDENKPHFKWLDAQRLMVQLPCGWWTSLTNHYQLPKTSRIIDILYVPPATNCPSTMTSSTGFLATKP